MSLDAILEAIRAAADAKIGNIQADAYIEARRILTEAKEEAARLRAAAYTAAIEPAAQERARILNQARLEAGQIVADARHALIVDTLRHTRLRLAQIRDDDMLDYPLVLYQLAGEALREMEATLGEGYAMCVHADRRDRTLLEHILHDLGYGYVEVMFDIDVWGGIVVSDSSGDITVDNTLDARFRRATPYLTRVLAAWFEHSVVAWSVKENASIPCPDMITETPAYELARHDS